MGEIITSIDLGTSNVHVIISEVDAYGHLHVIGVGSSKCNGIKKGVVVDIETTAMAVVHALDRAEGMANTKVNDVYISIPGGYTKRIQNRGIIAVAGEDKEITPGDVERVLNSATIFSMPQGEQIIDIIPTQYIVDGYDEIKEPVGMTGIRLEADIDIIIGSTTTVSNLIKTVNQAGLRVLSIVAEPFAIGESILSTDEKELGVLVIDIGAGTTDYSVFKNGRLIFNNIIPVAGNHISNDISIGLRISKKESEKIKKEHGVAYSSQADVEKKIEINPVGHEEKIDITEYELSRIIEARLGEVFEIVNEELIRKGIKNELLTGIVITGGGAAYYRGVTDLAKEIFRLPVRIGQPDYVGVKKPVYSTGIGSIVYSLKRKTDFFIEYENNAKSEDNKPKKAEKGLFSMIKNFWKEYF